MHLGPSPASVAVFAAGNLNSLGVFEVAGSALLSTGYLLS